MSVFYALIFDGNRQQLVKHTCESEAEFTAYLREIFSIYVCLWMQKNVINQSLG
ncbi:hypothetical protein [Aestuariibacter sp. A3R04]|uniref:hypothetical protein n=1 Tax=Aestuariibacter sp. A3R04 TaxID=2841571 RepID=UPI001C090C4F|nr:hypothetical protein [Aestuariibacter sp. A3R04]MBU3022493.1 hypothetical protein [Aestuariibacter sp. A3R04]